MELVELKYKRDMKLILFLILALNLTACSLLIGIKESNGQHTCKPIIEALENYKKNLGKYPKELSELTPKYLDKIPEQVTEHRLNYSWREDSYSLTFNYSGGGVGVGRCSYSPGTEWHCGGFY